MCIVLSNCSELRRRYGCVSKELQHTGLCLIESEFLGIVRCAKTLALQGVSVLNSYDFVHLDMTVCWDKPQRGCSITR